MYPVVLMRMAAPLMSFGGVQIDAECPTEDVPGRSMLTGLCANALGWDYADVAEHRRLQDTLVYAVRVDRRGTKISDFQTTSLKTEHMAAPGWTTWGEREVRRGQASMLEYPVIRNRVYWADCVLTVALGVPDNAKLISDISKALENPARPLCYGRKCCLPHQPPFLDYLSDSDVVQVLQDLPLAPGADEAQFVELWAPFSVYTDDMTRCTVLHDRRLWGRAGHGGHSSLIRRFYTQ